MSAPTRSVNSAEPSCPDCDAPRPVALPSRRDVLKRAAGGAVVASAASAGLFSLVVRPRSIQAAEAGAALPAAHTGATSETLVGQLYGSLTDAQRKAICFPFDHELRSKVDNNWFIVKQDIGDLLNKDQLALVRDIFRSMHSEEYADRVLAQVEHDNQEAGKGFESCAIALFGEPDKTGDAAKGKFEFVFTGRHVTRRCDGNSVAGAAFGGPIFYGHAAQGFNEKADHPGNAYWYQGKRANEVFKALDGKQREIALRDEPRKEQATKTVALSGKRDGLTGLRIGEMTHDQRDLVRKVLADLLAPFRKPDADEAMKLIEAGGFDDLHMAFYNGKGLDIGGDGVWDVWQIEGPNMLWYFRGAPHVHTWVNIREPGKA
jgi:hypothetical protein